MKKTFLNILLITAITPFLVQCASRSDIEEVRYQLRIVNKKLEDMRATTVGQLQKRQAAAVGQMDQLEQEIMELRSQLEETYHLNQRLREQNKELEVAISSVAQEEASKREAAMQRLEELEKEKEGRLAELNEKVRLQQESVKAIQEARIMEAERKAREAALAAELARSKAQAASAELRTGSSGQQHITADKRKVKRNIVTAPPIQQTSIQATPQASPKQMSKPTPEPPAKTSIPQAVASDSHLDEFKEAQKLFSKQEFKKALVIFEKVAASPSSSQAVEARFMMGECLLGENEYDKAIMQYQKIISQHPDHQRAAAAMLKQGMAFEKLADKDTAKVIYKKLLKKHGSAPEASIAQTQLDKL